MRVGFPLTRCGSVCIDQLKYVRKKPDFAFGFDAELPSHRHVLQHHLWYPLSDVLHTLLCGWVGAELRRP